MTEIEKNELISDFMGLRVADGYHRHPAPARGTCRPQFLQYHTNYTWLLLAWFKFRDLKFDIPLQEMRHSEYRTLIPAYICFYSIEKAFESLCEAIEWYNYIQNKKFDV